MPTNMDQLQNIRKQKRIGANSTIGCVIWQIFAQKSSSTEPEVTLPSTTWTEMQNHVTPAKAITGLQGPSFTRPRTTGGSSTSQQSFDLEEKPLKEEKQRGEIPMPEVQLQSKRIPPPWFFSAGHCKEKAVWHKQLTNSGHLTTVNQLQKALRMRGKELFGQETYLLWPESHTM